MEGALSTEAGPGRRESSSIAGIVVALALATPFAVNLLRLWQTQKAAALIPLVFAAGILACAVLAFLQPRRTSASSFNVRQIALLAVCALCGISIWMRVPYALATAILIVICFGIIGKRSWPVMIGVPVGSELLAYGVFKGLLGIPIH